jgi:DNA-directed RNA polymerase subunit RPC12/RpoP
MKYVYFCERCRAMFEVDVDPAKPIPPEMVCPRCEYPHVLKAFAGSSTGSSCCGPVGGGRLVGGG